MALDFSEDVEVASRFGDRFEIFGYEYISII